MQSLKNFVSESIFNSKTIKESIFDIDDEEIIKKSAFAPKTKDELYQMISNAINDANPKEGDTIDLNFIDTSKLKDRDLTWLYSHVPFFTRYNYDVSEWNVENITDISFMFCDCKYFNCDLSKWQFKNLKAMENAFNGCFAFDGDLSGWNVKNVYDASHAFAKCHEFTGKGLETWHTDRLANVKAMFANCHKFNADISGWSKSKYLDTSYMFYNCEKFDCDLSKWDCLFAVRTNMFKNCPINKKKQHKPKGILR